MSRIPNTVRQYAILPNMEEFLRRREKLLEDAAIAIFI
jgi:hypothetical protein